MYFIRGKIDNILQFINQRFTLHKIVFLILIISLSCALINYFISHTCRLFQQKSWVITVIFFFVLSITSLLYKNNNIYRKQNTQFTRNVKRFVLTRSKKNHQIMIDTKGGIYNENIEGNYIEGDCINHHVTIQGDRIEVSSNTSHALDKFREILERMIVENSNPIEGISKFAQELTEQLQKHPEVKQHFNATEDSSGKDLVFVILKLILTQSDNSQSSYLQRLNNINDLSLTSLEEEEEEEDRYIAPYKGYIIDILKDHNDYWHYQIQEVTTQEMYINDYLYADSKEDAVSAAKKKVKEKIFDKWRVI